MRVVLGLRRTMPSMSMRWLKVRLRVGETAIMPFRLGCQSTAARGLFLEYSRLEKARSSCEWG